MHVFLTGEIQIGKTTVIERSLSILRIAPGGFRTYFGADRQSHDKALYICPASEPDAFRQENAVVRFSPEHPPMAFTDRFNTYGAELVRSSRGCSELILMDECGRFERGAIGFQEEILKTLDGETPVLGVVRLGYEGWTSIIRRHPKVRLVTVTMENRDLLPQILADELLASMPQA